jgi:hypothetical protein
MDMRLTLKQNVITILLGALLSVLACAAQAEIYRWTDANGKVHFSDQPVANQKTEKVAVDTQTPSKPDPELEAYRQQTREQLRIADEERKAKATEAVTAKPVVSQRQCAEAKDALRSSMAASTHYDLDKNGNRVYSSSAEIEAYREKVKRFIAQNCR